VKAAAALAPETVDALSAVVAQSDRSGEKIAISGGDTLSGMGLAPDSAALTLSTLRLAGIVANESADLTVAVLAGTTLQGLNVALGAHGQFVPFDAPQPQRATVGGTLAAGWLGPRRHRYGRLRDYLIGSTIVLADGTVARAGGMVVKNVAGYDMSRLYVGSFGTLGIIVQANFKTIPAPRHARMFLAPLPERTRDRAFAQLSSLSVSPSAAFWVEGFHNAVDGEDGDEGRLAVLLEGGDALLDRATRDLRSALGRAGVPETSVFDAGARESFQRIVDAYVSNLGERSVTYRLASLPADSAARAIALRDLGRRYDLRSDILVDALNGDVIVRLSDLDSRTLGGKVESADDAIHDVEPTAQIVACEHPHRVHLDAWGEPPASLDRMKALKARFDPNRTLNPGRFVGGI
jgi:glycolate oxidase FAD binding subunit